MVTKTQLLTSIIFNGTNTIMLVYYLRDIYFHPVDADQITRWSYFLNSFFTTICLICDILLFITKNDEKENELQSNYKLMTDNIENKNQNINKVETNWVESLNDWNRNKYGIICNSFSYFITLGFWSLFFFWKQIYVSE